MSLMSSLTKVAIGFAMAKGMQKVQESGGLGQVMESLTGQSGDGEAEESGGLAGMLAGVTGGDGAGGALGGLLGGSEDGAQGEGGGLGALLGGAGGGLGNLLGGGGTAAVAGLGGIGGLLGGLAAARSGDGGAASSLEGLLSQDNPAEEPDPEESAGLMIRAMIMAARSDGEIDATEREMLMNTIGKGASPEETAVVQSAMDDPVDAAEIAAATPQGMETQVYSMSVMAIQPDNAAEAQYLHSLASELGISEDTVNEIHDSFGVQRLYG